MTDLYCVSDPYVKRDGRHEHPTQSLTLRMADSSLSDAGNVSCSYAIRPRLAIPAALAAGIFSWNHAGLEPQLGWGDDIAMIVGFLSFKVSHSLKLSF